VLHKLWYTGDLAGKFEQVRGQFYCRYLELVCLCVVFVESVLMLTLVLLLELELEFDLTLVVRACVFLCDRRGLGVQWARSLRV